MGLFNKKRKSEVTEVDVYTEHGNEVHVFDGPDGKVEVSKVNMADFLPTGEQWCPHCHVQCEKRDDGKWFECLSAVTVLLPRMQNCLAAIRRRHPLTIDDYC